MNDATACHPAGALALHASALFVVWEVAVRIFKIPEFFLPPPTAVAQGHRRILAGDLPQFAGSRSKPR